MPDSIEKETTFTPGPWKYGQECIDPEWFIVTIESGLIVANVNAHWRQEANARLIAAAPELYEALSEIELQWCPYSDADLERFAMMRPKDDGKVPPHWAEKILNARRVLRKARGEDRSHEGK